MSNITDKKMITMTTKADIDTAAVTDHNNNNISNNKSKKKRGRKRMYFTEEEQRQAVNRAATKWRTNNPEKSKASRKRWSDKNKHRFKIYNDRCRAKMTEEQHTVNKEHQRIYWRHKYHSDPEFRRKVKQREKNYRQKLREEKEKKRKEN